MKASTSSAKVGRIVHPGPWKSASKSTYGRSRCRHSVCASVVLPQPLMPPTTTRCTSRRLPARCGRASSADRSRGAWLGADGYRGRRPTPAEGEQRDADDGEHDAADECDPRDRGADELDLRD